MAEVWSSESWICSQCPQRFFYPESLQQHFQENHADETNYFGAAEIQRPTEANHFQEANYPSDRSYNTFVATSQMSTETEVVPANLKCGGSNFYSLEFAEKLQRSLPFIREEPRRQFLHNSRTDQGAVEQLKSNDEATKGGHQPVGIVSNLPTVGSSDYRPNSMGVLGTFQQTEEGQSVGNISATSMTTSATKWKCSLCQKVLSCFESLRRHFKLLHPSKNPRTSSSKFSGIDAPTVKASFTPTRASNAASPSEGRRRVYAKSYACNLCGEESMRPHDLKRHLQEVHFFCSGCSNQFGDQSEILLHKCSGSTQTITPELVNSEAAKVDEIVLKTLQGLPTVRSDLDLITDRDLNDVEMSKYQVALRQPEAHRPVPENLQSYLEAGLNQRGKGNESEFQPAGSTSPQSSSVLTSQQPETSAIPRALLNNPELTITPVRQPQTAVADQDPEAIVKTILFWRTLQFAKLMMMSMGKNLLEKSAVDEIKNEGLGFFNNNAGQGSDQISVSYQTQNGVEITPPPGSTVVKETLNSTDSGESFVGAQNPAKKTGPRPFKCEICSLAFKRKDGLRRHVGCVHVDRPHRCSKCGLSFKSKSYLDDHVRGVHEKSQSPQCSKCGMVFRMKQTLYRHTHKMHPSSKTEGLHNLAS